MAVLPLPSSFFLSFFFFSSVLGISDGLDSSSWRGEMIILFVIKELGGIWTASRAVFPVLQGFSKDSCSWFPRNWIVTQITFQVDLPVQLHHKGTEKPKFSILQKVQVLVRSSLNLTSTWWQQKRWWAKQTKKGKEEIRPHPHGLFQRVIKIRVTQQFPCWDTLP